MLLEDEHTGGCPMGRARYTHQTAEKIAQRLDHDFKLSVSATVVRNLLYELGYSLKSNKKCLSSGNAIGRDQQFGIISVLRKQFLELGNPVISVDTKKKELVGNFKNNGQTWCCEPHFVKDHDFRSEAKGMAVPYGLYDLAVNRGYLVVGQSADTPEFAVNCLASWWTRVGQGLYPGKKELLIFADSGGSNGARPRAWKYFLQDKLADAFGLTITVAHYPSGASKWNPIEHRLFSEISKNWAGKPLLSYDRIVQLASGTVTKTGLLVEGWRDQETYEKGKKISDKTMASLNLIRGEINPVLNYTIKPHSETNRPKASPDFLCEMNAEMSQNAFCRIA